MSEWDDLVSQGAVAGAKPKTPEPSLMDKIGHAADVTVSAIDTGALNTPAYVADVVNSVINPVTPFMKNGDVISALKGEGPFSQMSQPVVNKIVQPTAPRTEYEKYLAATGQAVGGSLVGGGEVKGASEFARLVASGGVAGLTTQALQDEFPNSGIAPTVAGIAAGAVTHHLSRPTDFVSKGNSYPETAALQEHVIPSNEGGGTIEHPLVNPKSGAEGPMQVMAGTKTNPGLGVRPSDGTEADTVREGRDYIAALMGKYDGDPAKAMAAYDWGEGKVDKAVKKYGEDWLHHAPEETVAYVSKGMIKLRGESGQQLIGSVPPMNPEDIASIMNDPEAAGLLNDVGKDEGSPEDIEQTVNNQLTEAKIAGENVIDLSTERAWKAMQDQQRINGILDDHLDEIENTLRDMQDGELPNPEEIAGYQQGINDILSNMDKNAPLYYKANAAKTAWDNIAAASESGVAPKPELNPFVPEGADKFLGQEPNEAVPANDQEPPNEPPSGGTEPPTGDGGGSGYEGLSPEEKLVKAIKEARPASQDTKDAVHKIRQAQAARLAELQANGSELPQDLAVLYGQLPTGDYESVAEHFTPEDRKALTAKINGAKTLTPFDKLNVKKSLDKILSQKAMGVPTQKELDTLSRVFSPEVVRALVDKIPTAPKTIWDYAAIPLSIPRAILTSGNFHAIARQGLLAISTPEYWKDAARSFRMFFDAKYFKANMDYIANHPLYAEARKAGLGIKTASGLSDQEGFFANRFYENMPGENGKLGLLVKAYNKTGGAWIRASHRAFSGFLARLRMDMFSHWNSNLTRGGTELTPEDQKNMATLINTLTGKGNLGRFQSAANEIGKVAFSAPLFKARIDLFNPAYWTAAFKQNPRVAMEAVKTISGSMAVLTGMLALAVAAGYKVQTDMRSSDFGKIRIGKARIDMTGGIGSFLTFGARMATDRTTSLKGKTYSLSSHKFGMPTRLDVLENFALNKLGPVPGAGRDYLRGSTPIGQPVTAKGEAENLLLPMHYADLIDELHKGGVKAAWKIIPTLLGNYQEYKPVKHHG